MLVRGPGHKAVLGREDGAWGLEHGAICLQHLRTGRVWSAACPCSLGLRLPEGQPSFLDAQDWANWDRGKCPSGLQPDPFRAVGSLCLQADLPECAEQSF